mmetsp:Transcript_22590/g.79046  ORF Transcript_22590/g.79046 Transcript_22590/m.79046 type:complete len:202 (-) Transcript_22590:442-1047(-)
MREGMERVEGITRDAVVIVRCTARPTVSTVVFLASARNDATSIMRSAPADSMCVNCPSMSQPSTRANSRMRPTFRKRRAAVMRTRASPSTLPSLVGAPSVSVTPRSSAAVRLACVTSSVIISRDSVVKSSGTSAMKGSAGDTSGWYSGGRPSRFASRMRRRRSSACASASVFASSISGLISSRSSCAHPMSRRQFSRSTSS